MSLKTDTPTAPSAMPSAGEADLDGADEAHRLVHQHQRRPRAAAAAVGQVLHLRARRAVTSAYSAATKKPLASSSASTPRIPSAVTARPRGSGGHRPRPGGSSAMCTPTDSRSSRADRLRPVLPIRSAICVGLSHDLDLPHEPRARPAVHRPRSGDPAARRRDRGRDHRAGRPAHRRRARRGRLPQPRARGAPQPLPGARRRADAPSARAAARGRRAARAAGRCDAGAVQSYAATGSRRRNSAPPPGASSTPTDPP